MDPNMEKNEMPSGTTIESFRDITFKGSTVLKLFGFVLTSIGALVWYLYANGAFSPDVELSKNYATTLYKYESLVEDHKTTLGKIADLEKANDELRNAISVYQSGIELERIKSEERARLKQLELENLRMLEIEKLESKEGLINSR